jgi:membrane protein
MSAFKKNLILWGKIFKIAALRLFRQKYTYSASALAFTTLLALVPLLAVIVSMVAMLPIFSKFVALAQSYIFANFIPTSGMIIQQYLENFVNQANHLSNVGLLFLLVTAITLIVTVEHTLNSIWHVNGRKNKISSFFLYWLILLLMPLFIGVSVFVSSYLLSLSWLVQMHHFLPAISLLACVPLLINTCMFALLYVVVPNHRVAWKDGLLGGLFAAILLEFAKKGFAFYIKQIHSYEVIYGAFASIPIFLLWIYISWLIILYGALIINTKYTEG